MKSNSWIQRILSSKNDKNNANDQFKTVESVKLPSNKNGTVEPKRKTAEIFDKFCLLMWKNCLIQYRHKTQTAVLILIPILFTANLPFIRSLIRPEVNLQKTNFNAFNINKIPKFDTKIDNHLMNFSLVYSPKNIVLAELLGIVARDLGLSPFHGVDRPEQVENITARHEFLAGVVFDHDANITKLPKNLVYTLRFPSELRNALDPLIFHWQTNMQYPLFSGGGPRKRSSDTGGAPNYFSEGFLSIQNAIANAFITLSSNDSVHTSNIQMQRFPYPPYTNDILFDGLEGSVGLFIMLSFVYSIISTVRFIAVEKEKQLKEIMKIMGTPVWLHWTSWFVRTMTFLLISNTFLVALLKTPICDSSFAVFTNSNSFAIWILLLVYSVAITTYCFMLSVLFSKANTAATVSGLIWFVSYMPFVFLTINHVNVPTLVQWLACVSPNVAMSYGFKTIVDFERNGHGLQWSNFWSYPITENNIAVGTTIYFMLMTSFVLLLMALYIEKVYPGEYGVPEKWNFFCNCDFWFGNHDLLIENDSLHDDEVNNDFESDSTKCMSEKWNWVFKNDSWHNNNEKEYPNFEDEPLNCEAGVRVINLRKIFTNGKVACKNVTFNMFRNQITVLLGHNGAGKSTTIKMLTGLIPPTSGTAIINGYDIRTDLRRARESIGICPQHDIFFDELTVREHIEFYCRLKGLCNNAVEKEVKKYVQLLNLESKIDTPSKALSGGMQRKLSFIVALCGDSKVVLCDEPTSGVDPKARRELWDLIQREKFGRTIILTTHFMNEADVLGDRIAIMADGEVKCCGTPFFLKRHFGSGYRLICVKNVGCDANKVMAVLREFIPEVELLDETVEELSYTLPYEQSSKFSKMFERLENELEQLKIQHFGVSSTELEEVFLKVGSDHKESNQNGNTNDSETLETELLSGFRLRMNHWYAMFKKRYYCWKNSWILILVQIIVLVFFTAISVAFAHLSNDSDNLPKLELSLHHFEDTLTLLQTPNISDFAITGIVNHYCNEVLSFSKHNLMKFQQEGIEKRFLHFGDSIKIRTNTRYLAGLSIDANNSTFIAWFNGQLFHSAPLSLNLLHNAILKDKFDHSYSIRVSNWPIPFRPESKVMLTMNGNDLGSQLAMYISFAMAFIIALYIMFHIRERSSKAKLLQFISGVDASTFWVTSFHFDFMVYGLVSMAFYFTIFAMRQKYWSTEEELRPLFPIFGLFGLSSLAITYVTSRLFSNASYGFVSLTIFFLLTGTTLFKLISILMFPILNLIEIANQLKEVFLIFPHYALAYSLYNMNKFRISNEVCLLNLARLQKMSKNGTTDIGCNAIKCDGNIYDWDEPGIGRSLTYMTLIAAIFITILWIIEYRIIPIIFHHFAGLTQNVPPLLVTNTIDSNVINEKIKVNAMTSTDLKSNNLVLRNLSKYYGQFKAVNGISVAVKRQECFGLLGVNGAGKTTTFKMITGDTSISSGDAFINGMNLKKDLDEVHKLIGYCPQFDALLDNLTGTQTLEIFGLLRGYRRKDISAMSDRLAERLNFTKHIDKVIKSYSGGNKRKLSTAIALMGTPSVVYLDEPSSGMDPGSKKNLWDFVSQVRNSGTSIVLTSHSMEECEALCNRIAIMVNGEFKCLGSAQHLKSQFSKGFILTIKIRSEKEKIQMGEKSTEIPQIQINTFILKHFPGAYLKEKYQGILTYYLPQTSELKWSLMFDHMETIKEILGIEDYSICQTTLEQVFLSFTKPYCDEQCRYDYKTNALRLNVSNV